MEKMGRHAAGLLCARLLRRGLRLTQNRDLGGNLAFGWFRRARDGIAWMVGGITEVEMATTLTAKGRVTVPKAVREAAGSLPGDRVDVRIRPERGVIVQAEESSRTDDSYRLGLEDMSRRRPIQGVSTEEIMAMTRGNDRRLSIRKT
jgi:antitoxin PrlF